MSIGRFYAVVFALLRSSSGRYLVLKRSPDKDFAPGGWETVTGRVDQGEGFPEAVHREIAEETGLHEIRIDFMLDTIHFYRGERLAENEVVGVAFCCTTDRPNSVQISAEHSEARWLTADEVEALLPADHWLVRLVKHAETLWRLTPDELLAYYQRTGFGHD
jgi:8-oxo-dGTP diphosphatase